MQHCKTSDGRLQRLCCAAKEKLIQAFRDGTLQRSVANLRASTSMVDTVPTPALDEGLVHVTALATAASQNSDHEDSSDCCLPTNAGIHGTSRVYAPRLNAMPATTDDHCHQPAGAE